VPSHDSVVLRHTPGGEGAFGSPTPHEAHVNPSRASDREQTSRERLSLWARAATHGGAVVDALPTRRTAGAARAA
jgi:hypothetical protein